MTSHLPTASAIEAAREEATDLWQETLAGAPEGWAVASVDLSPIVRPFGVTVLPTWDLVVLTFRWGRDGEGHVLAVPAATAVDVRHRLGFILDDYDGDDAPVVREATADVGEALCGERSDRGLLMASLAIRELGEVGAAGHGRAWLDEWVLEGHRALPDIASGWGAPENAEEWTWLGEPVQAWSPVVERLDGTATVRFFTYQPVGCHEIASHVDHYGRDGLTATRTRTTVARAAGGIVT